MSSYISSSDSSGKRWLKRFFSVFLLLTAVCILLDFAVYHYAEKDSVELKVNRFWNQKVRTDTNYAILLEGDSRVRIGLRSSIIEKRLKLPVYNCAVDGFGINTFSLEFFQRKKLNPASPVKIVVLGLTPYTMTELSYENRALMHHIGSDSAEESGNPSGFSGIMEMLFRPFSEKRWRLVRDAGDDSRKSAFLMESGWMTNPEEKASPLRFEKTFAYLRKRNQATRFSEKALAELASWTKQSVGSGIFVIGIKVPSTPGLEAVEKGLPGYQWEHLKKVFEQAGGICMEFPSDTRRYPTYDGIHHLPEGIDCLSEDLAEKILNILKNRKQK